jgi:hypothetical protein
MPSSRRLVLAGGAAAGLTAARALRAQPNAVELALVLAADCSGSVQAVHYELQQQGTADALRYPAIVEGLLGGPIGAVALAYFQWSGYWRQELLIPWEILRMPADIAAFARTVERVPRRIFGGGTSPGGAIDFGRRLLESSPVHAARRVIDVSGDGRTNNGRPSSLARDEAVARGIIINGLPILHLEPDIDEYYERNVIGGPGSFIVPARDFVSFADAMRRKLFREVAGQTALPRAG